MRDNPPDQPTPKQEPNEEQTRQQEEQSSPLSPQEREAPAAASDAPEPPAPEQQDISQNPDPDADLPPDPKILRPEAPEKSDSRTFESEAAVEAEAPLSMQSKAAQAQPESTATQDGASDAARKFEFETELNQAAPEEPEQKEQKQEATEQKAESEQTPEDGPAPSKMFSALSWITPLVLVLLAALFFAPLAYHSKITGIAPQADTSSRLAAAVETAKEGDLGSWFVPQIAGRPAPEVPPAQLWWHAAADAAAKALNTLAGPWLAGWLEPFMLAWLFLMATACLGWTDSRFKRKAALAAGFAVFCSRPFIGAAWFAPEALLAPTLSVMAAACLLRGLKKNEFSMAVFVGCGLVALTALAGGIIPAALPLAAVLLTILGTLNFRRMGEWDLVFGLGVTVLVLGSWLTGGLLFAGSSALRAYLTEAPLLLFGGTGPLPEPAPGGSACLAITALLPWLALPALMPVRSGKALLAGIKSWKNRTAFTEPLFLGGMLAAGIASLAFCPAMQPALLPAVAAVMAALAARSLTNLTAGQNRRWGTFCAAYLLVLAAVFFWMLLDNGRQFLNSLLGIAANISFDLKVWLAPGTAALIGALTMWFFGRGKSSQTGLLALLFAMLIITQAFAWFSIPVVEPYLKATQPAPPVMDIDSPDGLDLGPDGPRLHMPMPPELPVITPPAVAAHNATQIPAAQPDILGAPMPARHNATGPNALPGIGPEISVDAITPTPESGLPPAQNTTAPVPEAGNALYGDDLPALDVQTGPPPAPYQPGLHPQTKEPPLPVLDTPGSSTAPRAPLTDPYPPRSGN